MSTNLHSSYSYATTQNRIFGTGSNYEGQAGRGVQRQEERPEARQGVGFVHSSPWQDASLEAGEGTNKLTKHAQAYSQSLPLRRRLSRATPERSANSACRVGTAVSHKEKQPPKCIKRSRRQATGPLPRHHFSRRPRVSVGHRSPTEWLAGWSGRAAQRKQLTRSLTPSTVYWNESP